MLSPPENNRYGDGFFQFAVSGYYIRRNLDAQGKVSGGCGLRLLPESGSA